MVTYGHKFVAIIGRWLLIEVKIQYYTEYMAIVTWMLICVCSFVCVRRLLGGSSMSWTGPGMAESPHQNFGRAISCRYSS